MSVALLMAAFLIGGWRSLGFFIACGLWGKALLEIVNYMEHYGMVRDPARPVQPRHSWNSNQRLSSWTTFNLTRHSHHHAQGEVPFEKYCEIAGAMNAWTKQGKDISAGLHKHFQMTAMDYSNISMYWTQKMMADLSMFDRQTQLQNHYEQRYLQMA